MNYSKLKFDVERTKVSIRQLCIRIGITNAGYYKFMAKENMYLNVFEKLCQELKLNPLDYLDLPHLKEVPPVLNLDEKLSSIKNLVAEIEQQYTNKSE